MWKIWELRLNYIYFLFLEKKMLCIYTFLIWWCFKVKWWELFIRHVKEPQKKYKGFCSISTVIIIMANRILWKPHWLPCLWWKQSPTHVTRTEIKTKVFLWEGPSLTKDLLPNSQCCRQLTFRARCKVHPFTQTFTP